MTDPGGGGESGPVAGAGQDAEADNEPSQQEPYSAEDGSSEGDPLAAKKPRLSEGEKESEQFIESLEREAPAETDIQNPTSPQLSTVYLITITHFLLSHCLKDTQVSAGL